MTANRVDKGLLPAVSTRAWICTPSCFIQLQKELELEKKLFAGQKWGEKQVTGEMNCLVLQLCKPELGMVWDEVQRQSIWTQEVENP